MAVGLGLQASRHSLDLDRALALNLRPALRSASRDRNRSLGESGLLEQEQEQDHDQDQGALREARCIRG